ncbi:MAG: hypothetical protein ACKESB_00900, partial [Candidatus Hodgkinia cicadicola]
SLMRPILAVSLPMIQCYLGFCCVCGGGCWGFYFEVAEGSKAAKLGWLAAAEVGTLGTLEISTITVVFSNGSAWTDLCCDPDLKNVEEADRPCFV